MALKFPNPKAPTEVLDYQIDWSTRLAAGEEIATSVFTVDGGLVIDSQSYTTTTSTVWLSAGTLFSDANVTCTITTNQSRTMKQIAVLEIRPDR